MLSKCARPSLRSNFVFFASTSTLSKPFWLSNFSSTPVVPSATKSSPRSRRTGASSLPPMCTSRRQAAVRPRACHLLDQKTRVFLLVCGSYLELFLHLSLSPRPWPFRALLPERQRPSPERLAPESQLRKRRHRARSEALAIWMQGAECLGSNAGSWHILIKSVYWIIVRGGRRRVLWASRACQCGEQVIHSKRLFEATFQAQFLNLHQIAGVGVSRYQNDRQVRSQFFGAS